MTQIDEKETFLGYPIKEIAEIQREYQDAGILVAVSEKFSEDILERVQGLTYFYDKDFLKILEQRHAGEDAEEKRPAGKRLTGKP